MFEQGPCVEIKGRVELAKSGETAAIVWWWFDFLLSFLNLSAVCKHWAVDRTGSQSLDIKIGKLAKEVPGCKEANMITNEKDVEKGQRFSFNNSNR